MLAGDVITIPEALVHTVVAMGTVFGVLILISFVIYLLRFVPMLLDRDKNKKPEQKQTEKATPQPVKADDVRPKKKSTDNEIIAVIAAAVAATMTEESGVAVSPDGLIIRSIKKRR